MDGAHASGLVLSPGSDLHEIGANYTLCCDIGNAKPKIDVAYGESGFGVPGTSGTSLSTTFREGDTNKGS